MTQHSEKTPPQITGEEDIPFVDESKKTNRYGAFKSYTHQGRCRLAQIVNWVINPWVVHGVDVCMRNYFAVQSRK